MKKGATMAKKNKYKKKKSAKGVYCTGCGRPAIPDPTRPDWDGKLIIKAEEELCLPCFMGEDSLSENNYQKMRDYHFSHIQRSGMDYGRTPGSAPHVAHTEHFTFEEKQKINKFAQEIGVMRSKEECKDIMFTNVPLLYEG